VSANLSTLVESISSGRFIPAAEAEPGGRSLGSDAAHAAAVACSVPSA